jgi:hypothetical protein
MPRKGFWIPIILTILGAVLTITSVAWAFLTGVGIPDQDPTPAMKSYSRFHMHIVDGLFLAGGLLFSFGLLLLIIHFVRSGADRR